MISEQLSKYKKSYNSYIPHFKNPSDLRPPPSLPRSSLISNFSSYPYYHPSSSSSYQQTPKSKIALLNQKLIKQAQLYSQRKNKSIHHSHIRSQSKSRYYQKPFNPLEPIITRFTSKQQKIRKKNTVTKYKLTSGVKQPSREKTRLTLPPKSPFVVSEYLQSSARSNGEKQGHKSTAHSYGEKRGVEQIVFVTDQSDDNEMEESDGEYQPVKEKNVSKHSQFKSWELKLKNNVFDNGVNRTGSGFRTPNFNQYQQPILSPLKIQNDSPDSSPPYIPTVSSNTEYPKYQQFHPVKSSSKLANKKPIYLSALIVTLIAIFLIYEIIK